MARRPNSPELGSGFRTPKSAYQSVEAVMTRSNAVTGTSFKPEHLVAILADPDADGFFEVHAENYMVDGGPRLAALATMAERFDISLHGVCMSLGGPQPLDQDHLAAFAQLVKRFQPRLVSEHLAWSTHDDVFFNDLLPLPYTRETLEHVCDHVSQMQDAIGRTILLENPATYLLMEESTIEETEFLATIAKRTGCGLLLDINNVFVSATNHNLDARAYLERFPLHAVGEIHLAGHTQRQDEHGATVLIDSHDRPVADPVWALYAHVIAKAGPIPTLIEWDSDVPDWPILKAEAAAAQAILNRAAQKAA